MLVINDTSPRYIGNDFCGFWKLIDNVCHDTGNAQVGIIASPPVRNDVLGSNVGPGAIGCSVGKGHVGIVE